MSRLGSELTAEILRNALRVAAEEASIVVVRAAYSTFIVEGSDASAAVLDARGRLVAQSTATSLAHAASLRLCIEALLEDYATQEMEPGDVYMMNDAYRGGIHANDLVIFQPIFVAGEVGYFSATLIHVSDLGGNAAGGIHATATDVFQEGLQLPPVKLADANGMIRDITRILALNSRTPEAVIGDVQALVAGTTVARRRVEALVEEHGAEGLARGIDAYIAYSERLVRRDLAAFPDGTYRGGYPIDDDGIEIGKPHHIRVAITIEGDGAVVDFAGSSKQVAAAINSGYSQTMSGAIYALRCFLDPTIPMNEGCFAPFEMRIPRGSLLNPTPPVPTGGRFFAMYAVIDAIIDALSGALPERAIAASGLITPFSLLPARSQGEPWLHMAFDYGAAGARRGKDGPDGTPLHFGLGRNMIPQVEPVELRCPIVIECVEPIPDSGGAGRWRGGNGTRTTMRMLEETVVSGRCDRHRIPPPGKDGGEDARPGGYYRIHTDGSREALPDKYANARFAPGERFVVETSGGGGLGDPVERPAAEVEADLAAGRTRR
jgi:N-methylhydantoinase B